MWIKTHRNKDWWVWSPDTERPELCPLAPWRRMSIYPRHMTGNSYRAGSPAWSPAVLGMKTLWTGNAWMLGSPGISPRLYRDCTLQWSWRCYLLKRKVRERPTIRSWYSYLIRQMEILRLLWDSFAQALASEPYPKPADSSASNEATMKGFYKKKIRMLQRTQMLQRKRRNAVGRRSTRVIMTCRAFPLWLERQLSSLLSFVRFSYQFSSVICLFA
jgi:hypothetical protein